MDAVYEEPAMTLLQEPTIIEGITSLSGQISETINTSSWLNSKQLQIFIQNEDYIPWWSVMHEISFKPNNLFLNINNRDPLTIVSGTKSTTINYEITDVYGSGITSGSVAISLVGNDGQERPTQSGKPLKGFVTFDELRWVEPGNYRVIFVITNTGFGEVVEEETLQIKGREFLDELSFYFDYLSNEYGIYATMIGGFLGIIGFFRGSIARIIGRARKCNFCGSTTSSRYNFCSACGNKKVDETKQKAEDAAKNLLKMD